MASISVRMTTSSNRSPSTNCSLGVRSLLRRHPARATKLSHGPLTMDLTARRAFNGEQPIDLSVREWSVLEHLMKNVDRVISKQELTEAIRRYRHLADAQCRGGLYLAAAEQARTLRRAHPHDLMASATCWKAARPGPMPSNSIRLRLLYWLLAPLVLIGLIGGFATYWLAWVPARNAYDLVARERRVGAGHPHARLHTGTHHRPARADRAGPALRSLRPDLFLRAGSQRRCCSLAIAACPISPCRHDLDKAVFYDGVYGGMPVRVVTLPTVSHGERILITIAETTLKRQSGQRTIIFTLLSWGCALTGAIAIVGWVATGRGLAPLNRLQKRSGSALRCEISRPSMSRRCRSRCARWQLR